MWTTTVWVWVLLLNCHWSQATKRGKHKSAQDITRTYKHSINFDFWLHLYNSEQISFNVHWHHRRCTAVSCLWDRPGRLVSIQQADFLALTAYWNNDLQYQLTQLTPKLGFTNLSPGTGGTTAPCTRESNNRTVCSNSSWISKPPSGTRYYLDITENIMKHISKHNLSTSLLGVDVSNVNYEWEIGRLSFRYVQCFLLSPWLPKHSALHCWWSWRFLSDRLVDLAGQRPKIAKWMGLYYVYVYLYINTNACCMFTIYHIESKANRSNINRKRKA